jgi:hypothetical protein
VLLRLVYLSVTNVFALLRLLPASDRDKDAEILALRHQITVLQRQLGTTRPRFSRSDRAFLAACCTGWRGMCWAVMASAAASAIAQSERVRPSGLAVPHHG